MIVWEIFFKAGKKSPFMDFPFATRKHTTRGQATVRGAWVKTSRVTITSIPRIAGYQWQLSNFCVWGCLSIFTDFGLHSIILHARVPYTRDVDSLWKRSIQMKSNEWIVFRFSFRAYLSNIKSIIEKKKNNTIIYCQHNNILYHSIHVKNYQFYII